MKKTQSAQSEAYREGGFGTGKVKPKGKVEKSMTAMIPKVVTPDGSGSQASFRGQQ
jgi:hypothetical protein